MKKSNETILHVVISTELKRMIRLYALKHDVTIKESVSQLILQGLESAGERIEKKEFYAL